MHPFSTTLIAAVAAFFASGIAASPVAAAPNPGSVSVAHAGNVLGCVNEDGKFVTGATCQDVFTGYLLPGRKLQLRTAKGPCGIVAGNLECSENASLTAFTLNANTEAFVFDNNGVTFSGSLVSTLPSAIKNDNFKDIKDPNFSFAGQNGGRFEYVLTFNKN